MNIWPYISPISFCSAYGDSGLVGIVSVFGSTDGVAVNGRRAGEDEALDAGIARRDQQVERRIDVGAMRFRGLVDRTRHRRNGRLVDHVVHALDDVRRDRADRRDRLR